jgi:hypothetical protein
MAGDIGDKCLSDSYKQKKPFHPIPSRCLREDAVENKQRIKRHDEYHQGDTDPAPEKLVNQSHFTSPF